MVITRSRYRHNYVCLLSLCILALLASCWSNLVPSVLVVDAQSTPPPLPPTDFRSSGSYTCAQQSIATPVRLKTMNQTIKADGCTFSYPFLIESPLSNIVIRIRQCNFLSTFTLLFSSAASNVTIILEDNFLVDEALVGGQTVTSPDPSLIANTPRLEVLGSCTQCLFQIHRNNIDLAPWTDRKAKPFLFALWLSAWLRQCTIELVGNVVQPPARLRQVNPGSSTVLYGHNSRGEGAGQAGGTASSPHLLVQTSLQSWYNYSQGITFGNRFGSPNDNDFSYSTLVMSDNYVLIYAPSVEILDDGMDLSNEQTLSPGIISTTSTAASDTFYALYLDNKWQWSNFSIELGLSSNSSLHGSVYISTLRYSLATQEQRDSVSHRFLISVFMVGLQELTVDVNLANLLPSADSIIQLGGVRPVDEGDVRLPYRGGGASGGVSAEPSLPPPIVLRSLHLAHQHRVYLYNVTITQIGLGSGNQSVWENNLQVEIYNSRIYGPLILLVLSAYEIRGYVEAEFISKGKRNHYILQGNTFFNFEDDRSAGVTFEAVSHAAVVEYNRALNGSQVVFTDNDLSRIFLNGDNLIQVLGIWENSSLIICRNELSVPIVTSSYSSYQGAAITTFSWDTQRYLTLIGDRSRIIINYNSILFPISPPLLGSRGKNPDSGSGILLSPATPSKPALVQFQGITLVQLIGNTINITAMSINTAMGNTRYALRYKSNQNRRDRIQFDLAGAVIVGDISLSVLGFSSALDRREWAFVLNPVVVGATLVITDPLLGPGSSSGDSVGEGGLWFGRIIDISSSELVYFSTDSIINITWPDSDYQVPSVAAGGGTVMKPFWADAINGVPVVPFQQSLPRGFAVCTESLRGLGVEMYIAGVTTVIISRARLTTSPAAQTITVSSVPILVMSYVYQTHGTLELLPIASAEATLLGGTPFTYSRHLIQHCPWLRTVMINEAPTILGTSKREAGNYSFIFYNNSMEGLDLIHKIRLVGTFIEGSSILFDGNRIMASGSNNKDTLLSNGRFEGGTSVIIRRNYIYNQMMGQIGDGRSGDGVIFQNGHFIDSIFLIYNNTILVGDSGVGFAFAVRCRNCSIQVRFDRDAPFTGGLDFLPPTPSNTYILGPSSFIFTPLVWAGQGFRVIWPETPCVAASVVSLRAPSVERGNTQNLSLGVDLHDGNAMFTGIATVELIGLTMAVNTLTFEKPLPGLWSRVIVPDYLFSIKIQDCRITTRVSSTNPGRVYMSIGAKMLVHLDNNWWDVYQILMEPGGLNFVKESDEPNATIIVTNNTSVKMGVATPLLVIDVTRKTQVAALVIVANNSIQLPEQAFSGDRNPALVISQLFNGTVIIHNNRFMDNWTLPRANVGNPLRNAIQIGLDVQSPTIVDCTFFISGNSINASSYGKIIIPDQSSSVRVQRGVTLSYFYLEMSWETVGDVVVDPLWDIVKHNVATDVVFDDQEPAALALLPLFSEVRSYWQEKRTRYVFVPPGTIPEVPFTQENISQGLSSEMVVNRTRAQGETSSAISNIGPLSHIVFTLEVQRLLRVVPPFEGSGSQYSPTQGEGEGTPANWQQSGCSTLNATSSYGGSINHAYSVSTANLIGQVFSGSLTFLATSSGGSPGPQQQPSPPPPGFVTSPTKTVIGGNGDDDNLSGTVTPALDPSTPPPQGTPAPTLSPQSTRDGPTHTLPSPASNGQQVSSITLTLLPLLNVSSNASSLANATLVPPTMAPAPPNTTTSSPENTSTAATPSPPTRPPSRVTAATPAEEATISATTSTAVVASAMAGGAAAAGELQLLAVMGWVSCADPNVQSATKGSQWMLTPLTLAPGERYGYLLGAFAILTGGILVHAGIVVLAFQSKKTAQGGGGQGHSVIFLSMALVRFPSFSLLLWNLMLQGITLEAFRVFQSGSGLSIVVAAIGVCIVVGGVVVIVTVYLKAVVPQANGSHGVSLVPYQHARTHKSIPTFLQSLLPSVYWKSGPGKLAFGTIVGPFCEERFVLFALIPPARATATAIIASFHSDTPEGCRTQYIILALVPLLTAIVMLVFRPHRNKVSLVLAVITNLLLSVLMAAPAIPGLDGSTAHLITTLSILSVVAVVCTNCISLFERFWMQKKETAFLKMQITATGNPSGGATDDEEGDEEDNHGSGLNQGLLSRVPKQQQQDGEDDDDDVEMQQIVVSSDPSYNPLLKS